MANSAKARAPLIIGYGTRQTTTHCTEAMIVVSLQAVLGCIIQAFMVGLVFSKLSRPRNRSKTIIFSQNAIITMRNKKLCLVIRIGDLRQDNFILDTQVKLYFISFNSLICMTFLKYRIKNLL